MIEDGLDAIIADETLEVGPSKEDDLTENDSASDDKDTNDDH
jgi:hypothetical protein